MGGPKNGAMLRPGISTPTHVSWRAMIQRCTNKNSDRYRFYGGKGIRVCERWLIYGNFLADMGVRPHGHTLGRIDSSKDYSPDNCRWETWREQGSNRTNNIYIEYRGEKKTLSEWVRDITGLGTYTKEFNAAHRRASRRLKNKQPIDIVLNFEIRLKTAKNS